MPGGPLQCWWWLPVGHIGRGLESSHPLEAGVTHHPTPPRTSLFPVGPCSTVPVTRYTLCWPLSVPRPSPQGVTPAGNPSRPFSRQPLGLGSTKAAPTAPTNHTASSIFLVTCLPQRPNSSLHVSLRPPKASPPHRSGEMRVKCTREQAWPCPKSSRGFSWLSEQNPNVSDVDPKAPHDPTSPTATVLPHSPKPLRSSQTLSSFSSEGLARASPRPGTLL